MRAPGDLLAWTRTPQGRKMVRYTATSVICFVISEIVLTILSLAGWTYLSSVLVATAVSTVPSYELNRRWAWGKDGKRDLWKEVAPFWLLAFVGLAFSIWAGDFATTVTRHDHFSRLVTTGITDSAFLGSYAVLWLGKFIIFNKILFVHHPEDLPPALDGRAGVPG
ncbi:MAG TPA: GtrA family protein [Acidimicrobiales bacterium]|nr:GtrA family protein [Acidimicrobiales bacterium]